MLFTKRNMTELRMKFIERVDALIQQHLRNEDFGVDVLQGQLAVSYSNLYRKIKIKTGHTPSVYIRIQRLVYAKSLILESELTITEIAYRSGFNNLPYFSKCFAEYYDYPPSQLRKK